MSASIPRHVAVIPDGNRRWARARGLGPAEGHAAGIAAIGPAAAAAWDAGVEVFSFWWGSPANLTRRAPDEARAIVDTLDRWLRAEAPALLAAAGATFQAIGRWRELCPQIVDAVEALERGGGSGPRRLVLLMAYDGREEIVDAAERMAGAGGGLAWFERALWTGMLPPVDLVIRTGGEPHLSAGFLLWSIAEATLSFSDRLWPDYGPDDVRAAIERASGVQRRFGR
jgi:undecaprenyl diphosphate synthase